MPTPFSNRPYMTNRLPSLADTFVLGEGSPVTPNPDFTLKTPGARVPALRPNTYPIPSVAQRGFTMGQGSPLSTDAAFRTVEPQAQLEYKPQPKRFQDTPRLVKERMARVRAMGNALPTAEPVGTTTPPIENAKAALKTGARFGIKNLGKAGLGAVAADMLFPQNVNALGTHPDTGELAAMMNWKPTAKWNPNAAILNTTKDKSNIGDATPRIGVSSLAALGLNKPEEEKLSTVVEPTLPMYTQEPEYDTRHEEAMNKAYGTTMENTRAAYKPALERMEKLSSEAGGYTPGFGFGGLMAGGLALGTRNAAENRIADIAARQAGDVTNLGQSYIPALQKAVEQGDTASDLWKREMMPSTTAATAAHKAQAKHALASAYQASIMPEVHMKIAENRLKQYGINPDMNSVADLVNKITKQISEIQDPNEKAFLTQYRDRIMQNEKTYAKPHKGYESALGTTDTNLT